MCLKSSCESGGRAGSVPSPRRGVRYVKRTRPGNRTPNLVMMNRSNNFFGKRCRVNENRKVTFYTPEPSCVRAANLPVPRGDQLVLAKIPAVSCAAQPVIKILHIEDDPSVARSMARILRLRGFEVASAATHDEVIRHLAVDGFRPDLILTDFQLGLGFTAEKIVAEITAQFGFKPPTIMMTGIAGQNLDHARAFADRILAKPVDIHVLMREIAALLAARDSTVRQN